MIDRGFSATFGVARRGHLHRDRVGDLRGGLEQGPLPE